ncbi:MAG: type II 3-dehydroquinate dehydratase [Saprospiraceae bacterium]|jgi:3-dehydroquinate dehydratase-2|nr:type II 3-dehydroquinate dehydratase [Saprospiraceae bacterium]
MRILILNGPNLNLLGRREPEIYGNVTFDDFFHELKARFSGIHLEYFQNNHEGALIDKLHDSGLHADGIVINAGALAHTSIALADAVAAIRTPAVEVHISNVFGREEYRHHSWLSAKCAGCVFGLGLEGYALAVEYFVRRVRAAAALGE